MTSIGDDAFYGCIGLTSVTIPNSVTSIGNNAFASCNGLTIVYLESNAIVSASRTASTSMKSMFGDHVQEYVIGTSVVGIGNYAFSECENLISVTIPNSVTGIGEAAFSNCSNLIAVHITDLSAWCNVQFKDSSSNPLFYAQHFYLNGEEIEDLTIPNDVSYVRPYAFYGCSSLTTVTIPDNVNYIGSSAFSCCNRLEVVTLESNAVVSQPRDYIVFFTTSLKTIFGDQVKEYIIGDSVTSIGDYAFCECTGMTSITIPESVTSIGQYAFYRCRGLTSINISQNLTNMGLCAFAACGGLTSIKVEKNNPNYDSRNDCNAIIETASNIMLKGCQDTVVPESVTRISHMAFSDCYDMTSFTIPENVTSIGQYAFSSCTGMDSIIIGNGVTSIEAYAISDCKGLTEVYCLAEDVPETGSNVFVNSPIASATLYVPEGSVEKYQTTSPWSSFGNIVGLTQGVIDGIESPTPTPKIEEAYYELNGRQIANGKLPQGISIIRYSDGTTRKVLFK